MNESSDKVYIFPPAGTDMTRATVEVATRPSVLLVKGGQNWVLRGLIFEHANGCRNTDPAVWFTQSAKNVLIDNSQFRWNNAIGLSITSTSNITVQSSRANYNGQMGMWVQYVKDGLWTSDETSYNNWRGAQGAYYTWASAGLKAAQTHYATFSNLRAVFNQALGLHLDTDITDIRVDSLLSASNLRSGAQMESVQGPVTLANADICSNNRQNQPYEAGLNLVDASDINLNGSTVSNNGTAQVLIIGRAGGISVKNNLTGASAQVYNDHFVSSGNTFVASGSQKLFKDSWLTADWNTFANTLYSNGNTWWHPTDGSPYMVPVPSGGTLKSFNEWKTLTKQDSSSTFSNPAVSCGASPAASDFWVAINSASNKVGVGGSTSFALTAIPLAFSGTISLSVDTSRVPGASASWSSGSISSSGSSTLTVRTSGSTPRGTYPVTMMANSGKLTRTATVSVVVQ